ncbi:MAG TPA: argininosuccinate lyase [Edaphobacter sp.]|jgi:argininosuccinate lyase
MWSGRFREPLDPAFESWQRSFPFDVRLLPQEVAASKAHALAIAAAGILTETELQKMIEGLDRIIPFSIEEAAKTAANGSSDLALASHFPGIVALNPHAEDIHHFVELQLTKLVGDLALKLHTGRSRNEQIATDMRLFVRDAIDQVLEGLIAWRESLVLQARAAGNAVMPSYTHLQRAEPVLIAHWLLAYVAMLERDFTRLMDCRNRLNLCPLGSGAIAGATLALDRNIASEALDFYGPTPNSMDATSDRDFALEYTQALSTLGLHISRFAEELTLHSTAEFGFLDLPEQFSTGSSAMPQKKNPDLTELIRGKAGRLQGAALTLSTIVKGLPLAYNKDLQEGQEPVFDATETIHGMLTVLPSFTGALRFRVDTMQSAAQKGYLNAMAAATYLSNKGVPFRKAHEIIGNAVRLGLESGRELDQLSLEELGGLSDQFAEDFFAAITLEATLDCHDVIGGTARTRVMGAIEGASRQIESDRVSLASKKSAKLGVERAALV